MEMHKATVDTIQQDVSSAKKLYAKTLSTLESISQEIHHRRQNKGR